MADTQIKPTNEDLIKAVGDVLDEALAEYDRLTKAGMGIDEAQHVDDMKGAGKGIVGEGSGEKPLMAKEDKDKPKDKDDKDDDALKAEYAQAESAFKSLVAKMESRGLIQKTEAPKAVKKSEVPAEEPVDSGAMEAVEGLRKSFDDRLEILRKSVESVSDEIKKIASAPQARKGVTGAKPLRKTDADEAPTLQKSDVINKLLDLKKSGKGNVDSLLIMRVETGKLMKGDIERIRALGISE